MSRSAQRATEAEPPELLKKLQLRLRNGFTLLDQHGNEILIKSKKGRALLALLALAPKARMPIDELAETLWGRAEPRRNLSQERTTLHKLLRQVAGEIVPVGPNETVSIDRALVAVDLADEIDAIEDCRTPLDPALAATPCITPPRLNSRKQFLEHFAAVETAYQARRSAALEHRWLRLRSMDLPSQRLRAELAALTMAEPANEEWCRALLAELGKSGTIRELRATFERCREAVRSDDPQSDVEPETKIAFERAISRYRNSSALPKREGTYQPAPLTRHVTLGVEPVDNQTRDQSLDLLTRQITSGLLIDIGKIARPFAFIALGEAPTISRSLCNYILTTELQTLRNENGEFAEVGYRITSVAHPWIGRQNRVRLPLEETRDDRLPMTNRLAHKIQLDLFILETNRMNGVAIEVLSRDELIISALRCISQQNTPEGLRLAEGWLARALAHDPRNVDALTAIAHIQHRYATQPGFGKDPQAALARGCHAIKEALEIDPEHVPAAYVSAMLFSAQGAPDLAATVLDRVIAISAHNPALAFRGYNDLFRDRVLPGLADIRKAQSRTHDETTLTIITFFEATAHYHRGDIPAATVALDRALSFNPKYGPALVWHAGLDFVAGDQRSAGDWLSRLTTVSPTFSLAEFDNTWGTARSRNHQYLSRLEPVVDALRTLGLPQGR